MCVATVNYGRPHIVCNFSCPNKFVWRDMSVLGETYE